jgi:hypothetical protein
MYAHRCVCCNSQARASTLTHYSVKMLKFAGPGLPERDQPISNIIFVLECGENEHRHLHEQIRTSSLFVCAQGANLREQMIQASHTTASKDDPV